MKKLDLRTMLALYGRWTADTTGETATFEGDSGDSSYGLALLGRNVDDGVLECSIRIPETTPHTGAFVVFRACGQERYYAAGLGGFDQAYSLLEATHLRSNRLTGAGSDSNVVPNRPYKFRLSIDGQRVQVFVDGVKVIDYDRLQTTGGSAVGFLCSAGTKKAIFGPMLVDDRRPNAFVAMQFSSPYDEVYQDAINPLVKEIGFEHIRVDEISSPGLILADIWNRITESSVVIAEVSEPNPNVYYEIGAAHALGKPTVLLAQRGTKLPFDLGPHRCIFYDNTIPGRARLLAALRSSLTSLLSLPSTDFAS